MSEQIERRPSAEWVKFGVLTLIFLGTILVVALLRPYIFNHLIPAVMGENQPALLAPADSDAPAVEEAAPTTEGAGAESASEAPMEAAAESAEAETEAAEEETASSTEDEAGETLPTAVSTVTHVVQPGETIIKIAKMYGVTVADIIAANQIANPNRIKAGETLLIPQP